MKDNAKLKRFSIDILIILDNEKRKLLEKPRFKPVSFDL